MIVTCPNCGTKFDVPDDKYRPGRKARCSNCGFVFPLPDLTEAALSPAGAFSSHTAPTPDLPSDIAADVASLSLKVDPPSSFQAQATFEEELEDAPGPEPQLAPPASVDDVVPPVSEPAPSKRGNRKLFFSVALVFALALLGFGSVSIYSAFFAGQKTSDPVTVTDGKTVDSLGGQTGTLDQEKEAARQAAVSRLALENVRQHTVTENEKTGPMVVIEGTVVNNFAASKDLILLEVTLFDSKGNALVLREQYCGVTLSLLQLRTLSKAAIESALTNEVVILTNNSDIPPGGRVPFTTVFFDLPNSAYEFEVRIVDAQTSSPAK